MAPRALSSYALCSAAEVKRASGIPLAAGTDEIEDAISDAIEAASDELERFLCRQLVTRGSNITEYHTVDPHEPSILRLRQNPIIAIVSVDEGAWASTGWASSDSLTVTEDYLSESNDYCAILRRVSSGAVCSWPCGHEKVKVVYTASYANTAAIPIAIRSVAASLAARRYANSRRGQPGAQSITDSQGSIARFLPSELLTLERQAVDQFRRFVTTGRAA